MSGLRRARQVATRVAGGLGRPGRALGPRALVAVRRAKGAPADGATYRNTEPARVVESGARRSLAVDLATKGRRGRPAGPVPLATPAWPEPAADCAATWLGHATVLLEVGGRRVLADPVWSERCSPSAEVGPRRSHPVPVGIEALPRLDAVLISHDHYDHLDTATIDALVRTQDAPFVVPLGVGDHLRRWDVPAERIIESAWDQQVDLDGLLLTCVEARHFSGRFLQENPTLWSAWLVRADGRSAFFGGDTGYCDSFARVGAAHGPIDLTVLPVGAYDERWRDIHMDPAEAVRSHLDLRGAVMLPIHWATFDLAFHSWAAPADWVRREARAHDVRLAQPRPGQRWAEGEPLPTQPWWRDL